jgi:hypothetical protein
MEWTIEHHKFMGAEFFIVATELEMMIAGHRMQHTILVEYKERTGDWVVRDSCDTGIASMSMLKAFLSYIDVAKRNNSGGMGHCEWMIETGLPRLEECLDKIISNMVAILGQPGSVN